MQRRQWLRLAGLAALSGFGALPPVRAQDSPGAPPLSGLNDDDQALFRAIENLPWAASPGPESAPVYVFYTPWCGYCRALARDAAAGHFKDVQLRWIPGMGRNAQQQSHVAAVARTGDFSLVASFFATGAGTSGSVDPEFSRRANTVGEALAAVLAHRDGRNDIGTPMIILATASGLAVRPGYSGRAQEVAQTWKAAKPRGSAGFRPAAQDYLAQSWTVLEATSRGGFLAEAPTPVYTFPHELSVPLITLRPRQVVPGLRMLRVADKVWLEVGIMQGGPPGYLRLET